MTLYACRVPVSPLGGLDMLVCVLISLICLPCLSLTGWQSGQDCLHDFHVPVSPFFVLDMPAHMYVCHALALTRSGLCLPVLIHTVSQC